MDVSELAGLEQKIGHEFKNKDLLFEALSHSSFVNEHSQKTIRDNERLEFLGDAVLNLVVGHILMNKFPQLNEGDLSRMRAGLVNESRLAKIARTFDLGSYILLGKGEIQSNGKEKKSILADTYEALIAAVYLDSGFDETFKIIEQNYADLLSAMIRPNIHNDAKSLLQEIVQVSHRVMPTYRVVEESGPDHDKTFKVAVQVGDIYKEGIGKSKKTAEQSAAGKVLRELKKNGQTIEKSEPKP
jgi:ribonuclease III